MNKKDIAQLPSTFLVAEHVRCRKTIKLDLRLRDTLRARDLIRGFAEHPLNEWILEFIRGIYHDPNVAGGRATSVRELDGATCWGFVVSFDIDLKTECRSNVLRAGLLGARLKIARNRKLIDLFTFAIATTSQYRSYTYLAILVIFPDFTLHTVVIIAIINYLK